MRVAYADPPYLGCCGLYGHRHDGPNVSGCWDDLTTHAALIEWLCAQFPDGWALSLSSPSLREVLELCPADVRVSPWVKPFASFKPNVNPAYAWEPVIWRGGRVKRQRSEATARDWFAGNITLQRGLTGAKPEAFCAWVLDLLGVRPLEDELVDVFPGSNAMTHVVEARATAAQWLIPMQSGLLSQESPNEGAK